MLLLGLDLETTGLDTTTARIIELGALCWDTERGFPVGEMINELVKPPEPILPETTEYTGITQAAVDQYGKPLEEVLAKLDAMCERMKPDYLVAYNGKSYDFPLLKTEYARLGKDSPLFGKFLLDPIEDLPYPARLRKRKVALKYMASEHGFLNPFSHRAIFDVLTMFNILARYPFDEVVAFAKIPWITVKANVSFNDRELAKMRGYQWECLDRQAPQPKMFPKTWIKKIKSNELETEQKEAPFPVITL